MPRLPTTVLILAALGFLGFGAWLLVDPAGGLAGVDIGATSPAGLVELRAFYLLQPWHGQGLADRMMQWVIDEAQRRGFRPHRPVHPPHSRAGELKA